MTTTPATPDLDVARIEQFAARLLGVYNGAMLTLMIDLGNRVGLFDAAAKGPGTSADLAKRADLNERYVREWLGAMVTGGMIEYDPATSTYRLPVEHAVCLTGSGQGNMASLSGIARFLGKNVPGVARAFHEGGGVPYTEFFPEFNDFADSVARGTYDELLVESWVPLAPELTKRLARGVRVADIGCGTGHSTNVLARAYPRSRFLGFDISKNFIERAKAEANEYGLSNATFEVLDVTGLPSQPPFDVIFAFDMVHDMTDAPAVLKRVHDALATGGTFVMVEPAASSNLEDNIANPIAPLMYTASTLHCVTVSLAYGGPGLGLVWGEQRARESLAQAGFASVAVHPAPGDPFNAVFVAQPAASKANAVLEPAAI
jgi:SAM-dependent methyltransferase